MAITPRGVRNNNPGNIEQGQLWLGLRSHSLMNQMQQAETRFCVFDSPAYGIRALAKLLLTYQNKYRLNTIRGIINRWAPPKENDTGAYVNAVAKAVGVRPDQKISLNHDIMLRLVNAIIAHENGGYVYPTAIVLQGLEMAGFQP